jgi:hypothetical protein
MCSDLDLQSLDFEETIIPFWLRVIHLTDYRQGNRGTSMMSKSQAETEVSLRLKKVLEAEIGRLS